MRWTQDGRYGRPPRRSRIADRAGAAVGAVATLPAALPHHLRRSSSERRIKRFHSRLVWRVAAAGPAVAGSPLCAMRGRYLCAEIWRRFKSEEALIIPRIVKLLVFRKEHRLIFETIPLQDELSSLVKMLDDAPHRFGIQVDTPDLPRSPRRRLRHRQ